MMLYVVTQQSANDIGSGAIQLSTYWDGIHPHSADHDYCRS